MTIEVKKSIETMLRAIIHIESSYPLHQMQKILVIRSTFDYLVGANQLTIDEKSDLVALSNGMISRANRQIIE